jgi:hypothetical protein
MGPPRHGRACPGRGRVNTRLVSVAGSWMAGTSPAMTRLVLRGAIGTGADQHLTL